MSTLTVTNISNGSSTTTTANVVNGSAKAWININVTSIAASYNVSSITRNGTGDYTINFTTAFSDDNYIMVAAAAGTNTGNLYQPKITAPGSADPPTLKTATQCRVGWYSDNYSCGMAFFR